MLLKIFNVCLMNMHNFIKLLSFIVQKNNKEKDCALDFLDAPAGFEPATFLSSAKQSSIDLQSDVIENDS